MNKFFLFLAFASFALISCSDEPAPSHSELCKKETVTKECLAGVWYLEKAIPSDCQAKRGYLEFKKDGTFSFTDGGASVDGISYNDIESSGSWKLTETGMEITCFGTCLADIISSIAIAIEDSKLKITHKDFASFLPCTSTGTSFTEIFSWQRSN